MGETMVARTGIEDFWIKHFQRYQIPVTKPESAQHQMFSVEVAVETGMSGDQKQESRQQHFCETHWSVIFSETERPKEDAAAAQFCLRLTKHNPLLHRRTDLVFK